MRIAIAFDCFFPLSTGGGERLYRLLAESFARHGHEVTYLTRQQWTGPAPSVPGVSVRAVSGRTGLYDEHGNRRLLPALRFAAGLVRYLARHRGSHDVVLVSALPVLNVFAVRLALAGSRTLVCADFLEVWRREQWLEYSGPVVGRVAATLQRWAARVSPLVSCHSRLHAERLVADGTPNAPLVSPGLIHGAVLGPANEAAAEPPTVVYVGRHIPDKQVDAIPAAVAWARTQIPTLRAVVLGDGGQRRAVQAEVDRLGLTEDVTLPGFVEQEELDRHLAAAACLVNPSRREGYGLVVVEAAAHGTPVVLVDAPDNAAVELVEDGVNGVVATSLAPEVLGAALVRVVLAGPTMRSTTRAWYERAVRERTVEVTAERLLAAFAESRRR